jgi:RNA polymerase sigma-70 factor (ECF subfamily)
MIAVREGEVQKLRFLFERYQVPLYNYFLRLTSNQVLAEDFVQDVFMRILKYKHTYRGDGTFKG